VRSLSLLAVAAVILAACAGGAHPDGSTAAAGGGTTTAVTTVTVAPIPPPPARAAETSSTSSTAATTSVTPSPVAPPAPAVVLVLGDFGGGGEDERRVASAMEQVAAVEDVAAVVTTGDNFYHGDVDAMWNEPFGWVARQEIPVWAAWGNHDLANPARSRLVTEVLAPPGRWYATPLGPATLIVLDANQPRDPAQRAWLLEQLSAPDTGPRLVVFHQPAFSCGSHGSTRAVDEAWVPLFARYGVDLVLNGHDHDYQRFLVDGVTYVVTGSGGRGLYRVGACPAGTPPPVASDDRHHGFVELRIGPASIVVEALTTAGTVVDRAVIDDR